jgi:hypothetical protein
VNPKAADVADIAHVVVEEAHPGVRHTRLRLKRFEMVALAALIDLAPGLGDDVHHADARLDDELPEALWG